MKQKFKQYNVDDPMFIAPLSILIGDKKSIKIYLEKKCGFVTIGEIYQGKYVTNDLGMRAIILNSKNDISTLMHELVHYCFEVIDTKGVPISHDNDEVFAYYFEMMFKNITKKLNIKICTK